MDTAGQARQRQLGTNSVARHVALLGLASVASGVLVGGVGGRIVMRISAIAAGPEVAGRLTENGNRIGEFTLGGTVALIVFVGVLGGVIASVGVVASEPWLRWMSPLKGLGFGAAALAISGGGFDSVDFLILKPATLNVAMFVGLFIAFGLAIPLFYRLLDRYLPAAIDGEQPLYLVLVALGAMPLLLNILLFTSPDFCGCEPEHAVGLLLLLMIASTGVRYASSLGASIPHLLIRISVITGYGSLILLVAFGLAGTLDEIQRILDFHNALG